MPSSSTPRGAIVIDANVIVALAAHEFGRDAAATLVITHYSSQGYALYAPGAIISEALYALCNKVVAGTLTTAGHAAAVQNLERSMHGVDPPPNGDVALILRAEQILATYGRSRSSDSLSIALAEQFGRTRPTVLLTFDQDLPKQAAKNAPTVVVQLI